MSLSGYQKWECLVGLPSVLYYLWYIEFIRSNFDNFDNIVTALLGTGALFVSVIGIFIVLMARAIRSIPKIVFTAVHQEWRALILYISNASAFFVLIYLHISSFWPKGLLKICLHELDCNDTQKMTNVLFLMGIMIALYTGWRLRKYDRSLEGTIIVNRKSDDLVAENQMDAKTS